MFTEELKQQLGNNPQRGEKNVTISDNSLIVSAACEEPIVGIFVECSTSSMSMLLPRIGWFSQPGALYFLVKSHLQ